MTVGEAIDFTRQMLDEPRYEFHGTSTDLNTVFITALEEAARLVLQDMWHRGEKDGYMPLCREEDHQAVASAIRGYELTPTEPMEYIERVATSIAYDAPTYEAVYVDPDLYAQAFVHNAGRPPQTFPVPDTFMKSGSSIYTVIQNRVVVNTILPIPTMLLGTVWVRIAYVRTPVVSTTLTLQLPMAEYTHAYICDKAAALLYHKEHPGEARPTLGQIFDLSSPMYEKMRGKL